MLIVKNWLMYALLAATLFTACTQEKRPSAVVKLKGRVFKYSYGADTYKMEFISDSVLRWTALTGKLKGKNETDNFSQQTISADTVRLAWIQDDKIKINQQLNFKDNTVSTSLNNNQDSVSIKGKLMECRRF